METQCDLYRPDFDPGEFRYAAARYIKLLIRARWRCEAGFISAGDLVLWDLADIDSDRRSPAALVAQAAAVLAHLNHAFLPRCGSGGVRDTDHATPGGRLIWAVSDFVATEGGGPDHNDVLVRAARTLAAGRSVDWASLADWPALPAIRADLDRLPHPRADDPGARLGRIEGQVTALVDRDKVRDWYTTEQFAKEVGKAEFTVREWCRLGRVRAEKRGSGRGRYLAWVVAHDELLRYQREGLRPLASV